MRWHLELRDVFIRPGNHFGNGFQATLEGSSEKFGLILEAHSTTTGMITGFRPVALRTNLLIA